VKREQLVIGVDAGGSHTRVLVASADGARVAFAAAGGGNPTSCGLPATVRSLVSGLEAALLDMDIGAIGHAVLGVAGAGPRMAELHAAIGDVWRATGLRCPFQVVSDLEAAFAAGTSAEDGVVLVSGTGAAAAAIRSARVVHFVDGNGWLLGDDGSGFWLGRESLRASLAHIDGRGRPTVLTESVLRALGVGSPAGVAADQLATVRRLKEVVYSRPPVVLAELAPLVSTAAVGGDRVAAEIVERAAALLISTAEAALRAEPGAVNGIVLAGGVLLAPGPLSAAVCSGLRDRFGLPPAIATEGAAGAVVLALRALTGRPVPVSVHERVRGGADSAVDGLIAGFHQPVGVGG
jgi:N-acetylglucosamine kinase-like BadF-type ATPase